LAHVLPPVAPPAKTGEVFYDIVEKCGGMASEGNSGFFGKFGVIQRRKLQFCRKVQYRGAPKKCAFQ
jgi:hypothetical protein